MKKHKVLVFFNDMLVFILGGIIYSLAVLLFLSGNKISPGGITGIATILNYLFEVPVGTAVLLLNLPLLILGFLKLGGIFVMKTAVATVVMSVTLDITAAYLPVLELDIMLSAVFGGLLMGLGIVLFMLRGATTGGSDIVATLINRKFPHLTVGRLILMADVAVIAASAAVYKNLEGALYAIIAIYASSRVVDALLYGGDRGKIIYVITERPDALANSIMSLIGRGVTLLDAVGAYTGTSRKMLMCTVRNNEASAVCRLAAEHDKKAFIIVGEAGTVLGEGFKSENSNR